MRLLHLIILLLIQSFLYAQQDISSLNTQQQLEALSEKNETENEDDSFLQRLQHFSRHPLNLNNAGKEELEELGMLDEIQINQFLSYRRLLGKLISVYELQAIPGWKVSTIQIMLPYITLSDAVTAKGTIRQRLQKGEQSFLLRYGRTIEKAEGYKTRSDSNSHYLGSPDKLYMRYIYKYKNLLQYGLLGEKDAGEQFFKGKEKSGFDFYSFHLFIRKIGIIKDLAIGDYTISMGQGLIQWQGLALGMGSELVTAERQSPVLHPYNSPGEISFQRGAGITLEKNHWELTGFLSFRHISANTEADAGGQEEHIRSLLPSGYHRTASELQNKNNIRQISSGGVFSYSTDRLHVALNVVQYVFSKPLQKENLSYNLFAPKGRSFSNVSLSYNYTYHNVHLFGESAVDKQMHHALLNGVLVSLHPKVDLAFVQRSIGRDYQSLNAGAFTQNAQPVNETGIYTALTIRPSDLVTMEAYTDIFKFPWLRYRIDAPSYGKEYSLQFAYKPNKLVELTSRYKREYKPLNSTAADSVMSTVKMMQRTNFRIQMSVALNQEFTLRNRCEIIWYNRKQSDQEQGYLAYAEILYKPVMRPFSGSARLQYFETDGYNSRLYAYENSVLYGFSIPAFFDQGWKYYCNLRFNLSAFLHSESNLHVNCWVRWAQSVYPGKKSLSDGIDKVKGNKKSELMLQIIINE